jgi:protein-disulfide isomerase|tara:strand:+ start:51 stop:644 length:594 start_codon:yes stop_codon:yes gene_type:complete
MKKIKSFIFIIFILAITPSSANSNNNVLSIGSADAKITVKVFSSLTCPHCANFHINIFENLKKEFINKKIVRFEHHAFPLDLAALNAEIIVRCQLDVEKSYQLLGEIYKKQNQWAVGSDINPINDSLKEIGLKFGLNESKMNDCLKDDLAQDQILNERIQAQKNYKIQSTPTIYINEKKFEGKHNYDKFKKAIEKLL